MSTSEALANNICLVTDAPAPASPPLIQVLVINGSPVVVYPSTLHIPWMFQGTIVFTLAADENTSFVDPGVVFSPDAPYTVLSTTPRQCVVSAKNRAVPGVTGTPFSYDLVLSTPNHTFIIDPTVENDPPVTLG
jgi:hypothetical protein